MGQALILTECQTSCPQVISIDYAANKLDINLVTLGYSLNKVDSTIYKAKEQGKNRAYLAY